MDSNKVRAKEYFKEAKTCSEEYCKEARKKHLKEEGDFDLNKAMALKKKAMELINKAIKLDPDEDYYYGFRAGQYVSDENCELTISGYEKAIADLDKQIELNPDSYNAYIARSRLHNTMGENGEALYSHEEMLLNKSTDSFEDDKQISESFFFASHLALKLGEYEKAIELAERYFEIEKYSYEGKMHKDIYMESIENAKSLAIKNKELEEKENELEEMMAMFAHKFRGPLDTIIYNTTHENKAKLYIESAQTMRGLLDIFSVISTDSGSLKARLKQDTQGKGNLLSLLRKTLDMVLLHLLSSSSTEKVQQHYIHYAKTHDLCDIELSRKTWNEKYYEQEQQLQVQWEQDYANLIEQSDELSVRLVWIEQHFFRLELRGFDTDAVQFREYGYKESLLMILLNEVLVNAFKFYYSAEKLPVILEWVERDAHQFLVCQNPSKRSERGISKGSRKGHTFLSALARKTGSQFVKPKMKDAFVFEYGFPNEILISNQEEG